MNPQFPVPNSPFSLNPLNPNPQFNFPSPPPLQFPPPPQPQPPPPPPQIPLPDLPNSIASLKTLIQSSNSTLQSLTSLIPSLTPPSKSLIQCPSNPNHWLPSTSLFLHSLTCPSPLDIGPLVETLQYPKTLKNDHLLIQGNKFFQTLDDPTSELCFSIDDYVDFDTNFFYQDCPAVVSSSSSDVSKRMFTLPGVLSVECANFVGCSDKGSVVFGRNSVKILPSEVWFVGREIEQWSDYPNGYSWSVGRAMLCVDCVKECDLSMWVIENSPRFGVVIDASMRDHLCVLFRLCLKAMAREAKCSYGSLLRRHVDDDGRNFNPRSSCFKCPVLVEVLRWLTSQLSILYGEMNSRSLVIAMLRHLFSKAASEAAFFPLDRKLEAYGNEETTVIPKVQSSGEMTENEGNDTTYETIFSRPIFVYQIAAAIAALHERSLLEGRIRALRQSTHLTPYQRLVEHSHFSKKADEERQKRLDYRPIIEHDGLFNQRQHDQGGNKPKTKEELLAEERDYKRRRMSYRGKKLKRSPKEVMRDIIEDYMEAIKHAGGSGDTAKGDPEVSVLTSTNSSALAAKSSKSKHSSRTDTPDDYRIQLDDDYDYCATKPIHTSRRLERHKKESYSHKYSDDQRSTSRDRSDGEYYSRSPSKDRRRSRSRDRRSSGRDRRHNRSRERNSHSKNQVGENERSSSRLSIASSRKDKRRLQSPDRHRWKTHEYSKSDFESVEVNDRYDPSETSHTYDDQLDNSNYTRLTS